MQGKESNGSRKKQQGGKCMSVKQKQKTVWRQKLYGKLKTSLVLVKNRHWNLSYDFFILYISTWPIGFLYEKVNYPLYL